MVTDDSMSDDVFEDETLRAPTQRGTPSPTGYRDYIPPAETSARVQADEDVPIHKVRYSIFLCCDEIKVFVNDYLFKLDKYKYFKNNFSCCSRR